VLGFFVSVTKYLRKKWRRIYFGSLFQSFTRGQMAALFLCGGEAEHHGGRVWQRTAAHLMMSRRQREVRKGPHQDVTFLQRRPRLPTSSNQTLPSTVPEPSNSVFWLWVRQWIKPLGRPQSSWSNYPWKHHTASPRGFLSSWAPLHPSSWQSRLAIALTDLLCSYSFVLEIRQKLIPPLC
jgi:hypothetical protein